MRLILLVTSFCFFSCISYAQISIKIAYASNSLAALSSLQGEKISFIDSIPANQGEFQFNLSNKHSGVYRLTFSNNNPSLQSRSDTRWIDFIYDNEEVAIVTDANIILENLKVIKSESNKIYYDYLKLNKAYKTKTELLHLILARYPKDDDYYQTTKNKLIQLQEDYLYFVNVTAQKNPKSFIARYVRSSQLPVIDTEIPVEKQLVYLKTHALDNVNFYDSELIYSDAFTNKSIEYLTYYRNTQLPLELLEKEFMSAIDSILNKVKVNTAVYQHIVEYLLDGFKKFGFENVLNYIVENYVIKDDLCLDQTLTKALDKRIEQSKKFKVGAIVPDIVIQNLSGNIIELSKMKSAKTLIVFYASWCPHCQTLIPQIYDYYKNQKDKKLEVLAISIDTSKTDLQNFVNSNRLNEWMNGFDFRGWDGKAATDYFVYATPTMFLVNKDRKLIGMPKTVDEVRH